MSAPADITTLPATDAGDRPRGLRALILLRLQTKVFLLLLVSILAVGGSLQYWNHRTLYDNEIRLVSDKHLVIAKNLSLSLSRYVSDASIMFREMAMHVMAEYESEGIDALHDLAGLEAMHIDAFFVVDASNAIEMFYSAVMDEPILPDEEVLDGLRLGVNERLDGVQFSHLVKLGDTRYFVMGYPVSHDRLAVGLMNTTYIKTVQERIKFGTLGHSAIFDSLGRAVAHPNPKVEANMMDASGIPVVRAMLNKGIGVGQFYSPPMDADMIAGYTYVPETGWAVMVPQPIREISDSVSASLRNADLLTLFLALFVALFGFAMSRTLSRPIEQFTEASLEIANEKFDVRLPEQERSSLEMWQLNNALKVMVSRLQQANETLKQALELEERESRAKDQFLIVASHELRNPLAGVIGMLSVCKEQAENAEMASYLKVAQRSAGQLNAIVTEMIRFSEEKRGVTPILSERFDLGQELWQIAEVYREMASTAGLTFEYQPDPSTARTIISDSQRIFQILSNLLSNAIKFTEAGRVTLTAVLEAGETADTGWLQVLISDTGEGIDDNEIEKIFQPFFQIDGSYARSREGLGIGLSIVKSMVGRLNGAIEYRSELGRGTRVEVRIPVQVP